MIKIIILFLLINLDVVIYMQIFINIILLSVFTNQFFLN